MSVGPYAPLFEYKAVRLHKRDDRCSLYFYWCRPGTRRTRRRSAGTSDVEEAKRRLIEFADARALPAADAIPPPPQIPSPNAWQASSRIHATALGISHDAAPSPMVLDLVRAYVEQLADKPRSQKNGVCSLKRWIEFCTQEDVVYVREMNQEMQKRYVQWRRRVTVPRKEKVSNATINNDLGVLKAACRLAWARGQLAAPPYVLLLPSPSGPDDYLTADQCRRLLRAPMPRHLFVYIMTALHSLQRPGAIFKLRKEQIDLVSRRINFLPPHQAQSNKRRPVVPITEHLLPTIQQAMEESKCGYIVERDGTPIRDNISRSFERARVDAGLPYCTPVILRRTGATLLAAAGVPMRQIAGMLGHTHQRTTERYAKHAPEFLKDAAAMLDILFGIGGAPVGAQCAPVNHSGDPISTTNQSLEWMTEIRVHIPVTSGSYTQTLANTAKLGIRVEPQTAARDMATAIINLERAGGFEPPTLTLATGPDETHYIPSWLRVFRPGPA